MSSIEYIQIKNKISGTEEKYDLKIDSSNITDKGQPQGIATLDSTGKIPNSQLPEFPVPEPATTTTAGIVKPDGTTITVETDGTIHGTGQVTIDSAMSTTSTNPVQNKVISSALEQKQDTITVLPITNGGTGNNEGYIRTGQKTGASSLERPGYKATVEGENNVAPGVCAHAEGSYTQATGDNSHTEGLGTVAYQNNQTVVGKYNRIGTVEQTVFQVGNGLSDAIRSNAFEVYPNGAISTDNGETKIRFGQDSQGRYGYIKDGADTVIPFKNPIGNKDLGTYTTNGTRSDIDVTNYETVSLNIAVSEKTLQTKSTNITPPANQSGATTGTTTISPDSGYDGMSSVSVTTPMVRDYSLLSATSADTPSTVYNGDTAQSNTQKLLRVAPTKDGMVYTGSYLYIKPNSYFGDATAEDVVAGKTFSSSDGIQITGTGSGGGTAHTYGVTQSGSNTSSLTRSNESTNAMVVPTTSSTRNPKSFFDGEYPQAEIRTLYDTGNHQIVEIPKFQYRIMTSSSRISIEISDKEQSGFRISPAHKDRGDGVGVRDYVYIAKYKLNDSGYYSDTNMNIKMDTKANIRSRARYTDTDSQLMDYDMLFTIQLLYIVECANQSTKEFIGGGSTASGVSDRIGFGDMINYHTGTPASTFGSFTGGTKYRGIEDIFGNGGEQIDGLNFKNGYVYRNSKPSLNQDDITSISGTNTGILLPATPSGAQQFVKTQQYSRLYDMLMPGSLTSSYSYTKVMHFNINNQGLQYPTLATGVNRVDGEGLFGLQANASASGTTTAAGRKMILPSRRIIGS